MQSRVADVVIVGGGPAGVFCAQAIKHKLQSKVNVVILEAQKELLKKVKISGGGRCNVTHAKDKFTIHELIKQYPRGNKALLGQLSRFGIEESHAWFENQGVQLHTEADGRVFPSTNTSATIVHTLLHAAKDVDIQSRTRVTGITQTEDGKFAIAAHHKPSSEDRHWTADCVVVAGGSSLQLWNMMRANFGIDIEPPVPSLFTFQIDNEPRLQGLAGVSVNPARVLLPTHKKIAPTIGPVLITHNGLSGPAILRQSAFAALAMHDANYYLPVQIDWTGGQFHLHDVVQQLKKERQQHPQRSIRSGCPVANQDGGQIVPQRLWSRLSTESDLQWSNASNDLLQTIAENLVRSTFHTTGKATFKDEFVTAGGVKLNQLTKNLESKAVPGLFFAGEFLNVDGVTGGFNFTNCWSSGFVVSERIVSLILNKV